MESINMKLAATKALQWMDKEHRAIFLALTTPTLQEEKMCEVGVDDIAVEVITSCAYGVFEAPSQDSVDKVNSARSILNGQANGPTFSEAVKYLSILNIWRPWLPGTSPGLVLKVFQVCGIAWAKAKLMRNYGCILGDQMGLGKTAQALGVIQAMANDPEVGRKWIPKVSLIVVPANVLSLWYNEIIKFFPQLVVKLYGAKSDIITKDDAFFHQSEANRKSILLTTFNILNRRHSLKSRLEWTKANEADPLDWDFTFENLIGICIIDEASLVKEKTSQTFRDLQSIGAEFYMCLTATLCDNTFGDARGPIALTSTDKLWLDQDRFLNPFDLPESDELSILQGTETAYMDYVVRQQDPVQSAKNMGKLLKQIFRRITYDTVVQGPYGNRKVGEDIPPFQKIHTNLKFTPDGMERYLRLTKPVARKLMTFEESQNGGMRLQFHIDVFRTLHMMNTWAPLVFLDKWTVRDMYDFRKNEFDLKRLLSTMAQNSKYEWYGELPIEQYSNTELFHKICEESPIIKRIAFLVANVVFVARRNIIVWTDFPIPQFFIEMCLKAAGCPCESYHSGLSEIARQELLGRFNSKKEKPYALIMSTKLSAYGLNLQYNCSDEIMSGTSFSDPQEGQALGRIYRIGQTRNSRAHKLVVENSFMQVRMNKRYHKVVPDLIAHMAGEEEIEDGDVKYFEEISRTKGSVKDVVENLWREVEGVADGVPPSPAWFEECIAEGMGL